MGYRCRFNPSYLVLLILETRTVSSANAIRQKLKAYRLDRHPRRPPEFSGDFRKQPSNHVVRRNNAKQLAVFIYDHMMY